MTTARVAVIGAGWAGLSAAARLAVLGRSVTLFEATRQLGGRARRVDWTLPDGRTMALDNGQHILLGAYRETLDLMQLCGVLEAEVLMRVPVRLESADGFRLGAWPLPAPWHLLLALVFARGLGARARLDMVGLMLRARRMRWQLTADRSVAQWLFDERQSLEIIQKIWAPLCVAALNTPVEKASAQVFLNVLRDSLGASRRASDLLLPRASLDALLPTACAALIQRRAGTVRIGTRVTRVSCGPESIDLSSPGHPPEAFDAVVLAVPAHQVAGLIDANATERLALPLAQCAGLSWQPITTVYLLYDAPVRLSAPMLALTESIADRHYGQWVFDKSQLGGAAGLLAVVISAQGPHQELDQESIGAAVVAQLRDQLGLSEGIAALRVISEKRATFACVPSLQRPEARTPERRLVLAGDYTASAYPATLETAVASGHAAALQIHGLLDRP